MAGSLVRKVRPPCAGYSISTSDSPFATISCFSARQYAESGGQPHRSDIAGIIATRAVSFTDLPTIVPRLPQVAPGLPTPVYAKNTLSLLMIPTCRLLCREPDLSVTRTINRNSTLEVRYIGTLARKGWEV